MCVCVCVCVDQSSGFVGSLPSVCVLFLKVRAFVCVCLCVYVWIRVWASLAHCLQSVLFLKCNCVCVHMCVLVCVCYEYYVFFLDKNGKAFC